jgi:hypothetical protein
LALARTLSDLRTSCRAGGLAGQYNFGLPLPEGLAIHPLFGMQGVVPPRKVIRVRWYLPDIGDRDRISIMAEY